MRLPAAATGMRGLLGLLLLAFSCGAAAGPADLSAPPPGMSPAPSATAPDAGSPAAAMPPAPAADDNLPDISLLTFGPGSIYWEHFGHNAILVSDSRGDTAYNYGLFDFRQKNFFLNFARGYMTYRMAGDPVMQDLRFYDWEGRWVVSQHLDLTPAQRISLRDYLVWNARPENMHYRYDYFRSNCSTRVRDGIDQALGGALRRQLENTPTTTTYRSEAIRLISPDRGMMLAMDLALGPTADQSLTLWQQSFVPMVFMRAMRNVTITDADGHSHPLVDKERRLLPGRLPDEVAQAPDLRGLFTVCGIAFAALLWSLARIPQSRIARLLLGTAACSYALFCSIGGLIFAALWGLTEHWAGWHNQNLLLLDPLCLLLLPGWWRLSRRNGDPGQFAQRLSATVAVIGIGTVMIKLVPGIPAQDNSAWIILFLPAHLVLAAIAWQRHLASPTGKA